MKEKRNSTKSAILSLSLLALLGTLLGIGAFLYQEGWFSKRTKNSSIEKLTESVQADLDNNNFESAYNKVDLLLDKYATGNSLNEKILTQEIVSLIETDEDGNNAPRIIYAISERARYNHEMGYYVDYYRIDEEKKMYKTAIRTSEAIENDQLTEKLKKALETLEEEQNEE